MVDVLDRDAEVSSSATGSATVALHTHEGMIREACVVDVKMSERTESRAFAIRGFMNWIPQLWHRKILMSFTSR